MVAAPSCATAYASINYLNRAGFVQDMALRKERKNHAAKIMAWVVAIVMVASVFGIVLDYVTTNSLEYNGQKFTLLSNGQYIASIDGQRLTFYSFPTEVESVPLDKDLPALLNDAQILIVTFDPSNKSDQDLAVIDYIRYDLSLKLKSKSFSAVMINDSRYPLPLITCENASSYAPILLLDSTNESQSAVTRQGNCIYLTGAQQGLLRAYDRLMFGYYGIIPAQFNAPLAAANSTQNNYYPSKGG